MLIEVYVFKEEKITKKSIKKCPRMQINDRLRFCKTKQNKTKIHKQTQDVRAYRGSLIYSDHFLLIVKMSLLPKYKISMTSTELTINER